jgi:hypothetical protein
MRWSLALLAGIALALCGCRSAGRCDAVEAELRAREADVNTLKAELDREHLNNQLLVRELAVLHGLPGPHGVPRHPGEPYPVVSIALGRRTGGRYDERLGGDDALEVQLEPRDTEGQTIKAPGAAHVEAYEVTAEGVKAPLSSWTVTRDELRTKWQTGLFSTGYLITLPWKVPPATERLRVVVRFQMLSGRLFEADRDVTIRLLPGARERRKGLPVPAPGTVLPAPLPVEEIPAPEKPPERPPEKKKELPPPSEEGPVLMRSGASGRVELSKPMPLPAGAGAPVVSDAPGAYHRPR